MPTAAVNDVRLDYEQWGDPADPSVVLIMGLGGQRVLWGKRFVSGLVDHGLHVVAFDNRDVGCSTVLREEPGGAGPVAAFLSGDRPDPAYRLEDMADDVVGLLDALEIERAHPVGASMGGMIAQHLGFDHPDRVAGLTLLSTTAGDWEGSVPPPHEAPPQEFLPPTEHDAFLEWFVTGCRELSDPESFDEDEVRELAELIFQRGVHPDGMVRQLLAVLADGDRMQRLGRATAPTLVIHGAKDPLIGVAAGERLAGAVPGARLLVFDEMGHDLPDPLLPDLVTAVAEHIQAASRGRPLA